MSGILPQSIQILTARAKASTDDNGLAETKVKIPTEGRTISGGIGFFENIEPGDYLTIEIRDDDNILEGGVGAVVSTFDDQLVPVDNQGYYFMGNYPLEVKPLVGNDSRILPGGLYLYICGHKADTATSDTLYVNIFWGRRIR